jgi:hypothetical protein
LKGEGGEGVPRELDEVARTVRRELDAAREKVPPRVLAAIESAANAGTLGRARDALRAFRAERPDEAAAAAVALRVHAPFVAAALADALEPEARASSRWRALWPLPVAAIALVVAVRFARQSTAPSVPTVVTSGPRAPAADPTRAFQRFEDSLYPDADADERTRRQRVESAAEAIERALPGHDEIASAALDVESSARRGDCASLRPRATLLTERVRAAVADAAPDASDARQLIGAFDGAITALCPR